MVARAARARAVALVRVLAALRDLGRDGELRVKQPHGAVPQGHRRVQRGADRQLPERPDGLCDRVDAGVCDVDGLHAQTVAGARVHESGAHTVEYLDFGVEDAGRGEVLCVL